MYGCVFARLTLPTLAYTAVKLGECLWGCSPGRAAGSLHEEALEMDLLNEALDPGFVTVQVAARTSVRALSLENTVG